MSGSFRIPVVGATAVIVAVILAIAIMMLPPGSNKDDQDVFRAEAFIGGLSTFDDVVRRAEIIVEARLEREERDEYQLDEHGARRTDVVSLFAVTRLHKGAHPGERIEVVTTVGDRLPARDGAPEIYTDLGEIDWETGRDYLLLLERVIDGRGIERWSWPEDGSRALIDGNDVRFILNDRTREWLESHTPLTESGAGPAYPSTMAGVLQALQRAPLTPTPDWWSAEVTPQPVPPLQEAWARLEAGLPGVAWEDVPAFIVEIGFDDGVFRADPGQCVKVRAYVGAVYERPFDFECPQR